MERDHTSTHTVETPRLRAARTRMFSLMLEIAVAFAVPAVIAAVAGTRLDAAFGTGRVYSVGALFISFAASWTYVAWKYKKTVAELRAAKSEQGAEIAKPEASVVERES